MPGAAPPLHRAKPVPPNAGREFSGSLRTIATGGPHKPNDRLIRPYPRRESVVWPPAGAARRGGGCLVTPL
ncbi:hypothetical protein DF160_09525 [Burkholderia anthina]|nr:hypothetical protein CFB35_07310 [Burkholderia sp. AU16482]RQV84278.1 hypothetical protein DF160_09525 [Burkholderia anthina]